MKPKAQLTLILVLNKPVHIEIQTSDCFFKIRRAEHEFIFNIIFSLINIVVAENLDSLRNFYIRILDSLMPETENQRSLGKFTSIFLCGRWGGWGLGAGLIQNVFNLVKVVSGSLILSYNQISNSLWSHCLFVLFSFVFNYYSLKTFKFCSIFNVN